MSHSHITLISVAPTLRLPEHKKGTTRTQWRVLTLKHRVVAAPVQGAEIIPRFIPVNLAHPRRQQVQTTSVTAH